jgi:NADH-quinone oxidoreductase subunit C
MARFAGSGTLNTKPETLNDLMAGTAFVDQLKAKFGAKIAGANFENLDPWIEVTPDGLLEVCRYLHDEPTLAFDFLNCISGVDYLHTDEKKAAKSEWQPHTEVVYHLFSMKHKHSLVLKVILPRWKNDKAGELPEVPSVSGIWSTADWHEREVYDLSGIFFVGHPNSRRILCPEDWVGHPLRKDYEMPLEYHGIRGR